MPIARIGTLNQIISPQYFVAASKSNPTSQPSISPDASVFLGSSSGVIEQIEVLTPESSNPGPLLEIFVGDPAEITFPIPDLENDTAISVFRFTLTPLIYGPILTKPVGFNVPGKTNVFLRRAQAINNTAEFLIHYTVARRPVGIV